MDSKNSRRFQSTSYFSDDVVESNWGQQMFRGSLLLRWSATQMKSGRTTTMKEMKGSIGSYRTSHINRTPQTTTSNSFLGFSVWYFPTSTEHIQQASSHHALTVNNFHNCQVTFSVIQGQRGSPKVQISINCLFEVWLITEQLQTCHSYTDFSCSWYKNLFSS